MNVLKRIGRFLNFESRKTIYHAFIMSAFNCCPLIWHFCIKANTNKLERINYRALRFVIQDHESSYEALLQKIEGSALHIGRLRKVAIVTY